MHFCPLLACCALTSINDRGRIRNFLKLTLKIGVMGSKYGASLLCDFPCGIQFQKFVNLTITTDHRETLNILLINGVIRSVQQKLPKCLFLHFLVIEYYS